MAAQNRCMLIGIDFGTTFSGFAYTISERLAFEGVNVVTSWRTTGACNSDDSKVPSKICYKDEEQLWGYDDSLEDETLRWFKLLLVDQEELQDDVRRSEHLDRARTLMQKHHRSSVEVVADYLGHLWKHALECMERELGATVVTSLPFKVVLTVPAIWKDKTRRRMMQAADLAGINNYRLAGKTVLDLVSEPEAAALATLDDFKGRSDVKPNDIYVVCDAGGGTVDIITYRIKSTNPMVMEEYVGGKGKLCGAVNLDKAFEEVIKFKLGRGWDRLTSDDVKQTMENEWERGIKRTFNGSGQTYTFSPPAKAFRVGRVNLRRPLEDQNNGISGGQIRLGGGEVRAIFDPVIGTVRSLVGQQVNEAERKGKVMPKAVILVGGLGGSNFLYQQLKAQQDGRGVDILQPSGPKPWTAICRGAALRAGAGFHGSHVASRISRTSFGIVFATDFVEGEHLEGDKFWDGERGCWAATNQVRWYLRKGTRLDDQKAVKFAWTQAKTSLAGNWFSLRVYECDSAPPPGRLGPNVLRLCEINCRLPRPFESLKAYLGKDGKTYRRLCYNIEMTPTDSGFSWDVLMDGTKVGSENIKIAYQ